MEQTDYSSLLPTEPPEGFLEWLHVQGGLDDHLLIYSSTWWKNSISGKKERKIRLVCSYCGEESIADKAESGGCMNVSGFLHPRTGDFMSRHGGINCNACCCPKCGYPVKVKHKKELKNHYSLTACHAMTVHKIQDNLVLCGWRVMKHFDDTGGNFPTIHPYEAYVVEKRKIVRINAWVGSHFGNERLTGQWVQRKQYRDAWGRSDFILPWNPDLLIGTTAENCKLDLYLEELNLENAVYPIAYLKAWLKHKNLENLLVQGASHLVAEMIEADATKEKKSLDGLQLVNFKEVRPSKMLGLEKNQVKSLVEERWSVETLKIFHFLKENNYPTSHEFHQECAQLRYRQCLDIAREFPEVFSSIVLYLKKQRKKDSRNDFAMLKDYWNMAEPLGLDLENPDVQFPSRLHSAHDRVMELYKQESLRINEAKMAECFRKRERFSWENENIMIRPVKSSDELKEEGRLLRHCVYGYSRDVEQGRTSIFFIRRKKEPDKPWFTLEFDVEHMIVKQNRGKHNCVPPEEVNNFVEEWLKHIKEVEKKQKSKQKKKRGNAA